MTINVLRIDTSLFGDVGQSSQLNTLVEHQLREQHPDLTLVKRDLGLTPLPHLSADLLQALGTASTSRNAQQASAVALADAVIAEVQAADIIVLAAPMYNFSIPSALKSWLDYLARAGTTFHYTAQGPEGLLADKPVYIQTTRGGVHQGAVSDTITPLLTTFLNFVGLKDLRFNYAEGLNVAALKEQGLARAKASISASVH